MRSFSTLPYFAALAAASIVKELDSTNINSFVAEHELSLVSFIAPWCQYCKELEPEYEAAAVALESEGWPLARVDCEADKDLCKEYRVPIYPTIRVFHGSNHTIYNGRRNTNAIVQFMKRHSQPVISVLNTTQDVDAFRTKDKVSIVAYLDETDVASRTVFDEIAVAERDNYLFGSISGDSFGNQEGLKKPSIVLYKTFDEGKSTYDGLFEQESILDFIAEAGTPAIQEIGVDITRASSERGIPMAFIFSENAEERKQLIEALRPVARSPSGDELAWMIVDPSKHPEYAPRMALKPGAWPAFAIEDLSKDNFKYAAPERGSIKALEPAVVQQIVDDFVAKKLTSSIRSEPIPEQQDGPVLDVVALNYNESVLKSEQDTFVLFYSPTCGHCKKMKPAYEQFAEALSSHKANIVVARIDATANDVKPVVKSYPTLMLFKAGSKDTPVDYEGDRSAEDFVRFVKENASESTVKALADLPEIKVETVHDEL